MIANWATVTHGTFTLYGVSTYSNDTLFWWMIAWAVVAIVIARLFRDSGLGLALRATSSDELVARAVGVNLPLARLAGWVLAAGFAAVGGALYMKFLGSLAPTTFSFTPVIVITLVMFIVGGRSVSGVVVGATLVAFIDEVAEADRERPAARGPRDHHARRDLHLDDDLPLRRALRTLGDRRTGRSMVADGQGRSASRTGDGHVSPARRGHVQGKMEQGGA